MNLDEAAHVFREFVAIVQALRTPRTGCPWDLEQTHQTLRPYLIEEAYEVLEALDSGDDHALREELGDLLLQVVLHAQLADDRGAFAISEVVRGIADKMIRRHPHVFGSVQVSSAAEVLHNWEQIKAAEAKAKGAAARTGKSLGHRPKGLPALQLAQRLGEKAAKVQATETDLEATLGATSTQFGALVAAVKSLADQQSLAESARSLSAEWRERLEQEFGDLLFGLCQLARWLGFSAEDSLRASARRFAGQFDSGPGPE
jgi:MazG family protein